MMRTSLTVAFAVSLGHLDVVEARRADWALDPFVLTERGGYFYGRGTLDMRNGAAAWVAALLRMKQDAVVPAGDYVLALTAGEEGGGGYNGIEWLLANRPALIEGAYVLNADAGGGELRDGKPAVFDVQAAEKVFQTYALTVRNAGGHSSLPTKDNAIYRLAAALGLVAAYDFPVQTNAVTRGYFARTADLRAAAGDGAEAADLRAVSASDAPDAAGAARLAARSPFYNAQLRTTCIATQLAAGHTLRAMELAARGAAQFPNDAGLYVLYTELVQAERDSVVPRGLAVFPKSAELHALASKDLKTRGKAEEALAAMQQAVALDSTLPQGVLAIAQAEFDLGRPDSAFVSLARALECGEDTAAGAQFALAKGNVLLRAAGQTQVRDDYGRALRFFVLADSARSTPQSKFLLGTAALNVSKSALTEAPKLADKPASCALARLGGETLAAARAGLEAGQAVAPEVARQYLDYVGQIAPFAEKQVTLYCDAAPPAGAAPAPTIP